MFPQVFGKYILERELTRGGMARLLLGTLRGAGGFEKKLVVKQIREELCTDPHFVARFVEEAKTTVTLSHPNIVAVYELGVEQGTYFLAMELVEGCTIHELLRAGDQPRRRLTAEEGAYVGVEVCRALDYAHRRMQVVHRDVTPRNVMVDEEGQVKVIDFGIAAPARIAGHEVFGSPGHMPPEQVRGAELGPATDLFAVAVLLMEAWSGTAPFRRATDAECDAAMRAPHPKPSDADPRLLPLDDVISRAMSLDPKERPSSADELGRALRKFLTGVDVADVAKELGGSVRNARKALAQKRAREEHPERRASRPSAPSHSDFSTKTFAQRDEVKRWTSSAPPPMGGPSTRPLPASVPPPPNDGKIETVATRPLETPARGPGPAASSPRKKSAFLLAGAAAIGVAASFAFRGSHGKTPADPASGAPLTPLASTTAAPAGPSSAGTPAAPASAPQTASSASSGATTAASASPARAVKAHLALFGDPGTVVLVDGKSRGSVPVRDLALDPGSHEVLFRFEATGEQRGDRITVAPGEHVRLRADFTGAVPTIRVER